MSMQAIFFVRGYVQDPDLTQMFTQMGHLISKTQTVDIQVEYLPLEHAKVENFFGELPQHTDFAEVALMAILTQVPSSIGVFPAEALTDQLQKILESLPYVNSVYTMSEMPE